MLGCVSTAPRHLIVARGEGADGMPGSYEVILKGGKPAKVGDDAVRSFLSRSRRCNAGEYARRDFKMGRPPTSQATASIGSPLLPPTVDRQQPPA
jgi:hypothetical protein